MLRALLTRLQVRHGLRVRRTRDQVCDRLARELTLGMDGIKKGATAALEGSRGRKGDRERLLRRLDLRHEIRLQLRRGRRRLPRERRGAQLLLQIPRQPAVCIDELMDCAMQLREGGLPTQTLVRVRRVRIE